MFEVTPLTTATTGSRRFDDTEERLFLQQLVHSVFAEDGGVDLLCCLLVPIKDPARREALRVRVLLGEQRERVENELHLCRRASEQLLEPVNLLPLLRIADVFLGDRLGAVSFGELAGVPENLNRLSGVPYTPVQR